MTKELEKGLFNTEDLFYDLEEELSEFSLPEDDRPPLERFKDCSRWGCPLSEICSVLCVSTKELDQLAQSGGFKDAKALMEYYKQEALDMCFDKIKKSAAGGDRKSKAFLKRYLPQYEGQKRG